jgi:hypothetical protein
MDRLERLFLDKPELVDGWPEWMLPASLRARLAGDPGLAVVEIAGRDSVAAAVKAVIELGLTVLLPTYVYTGTEHGPWAAVSEAVTRLGRRLPPSVELAPLVVMGWPRLWQAVNGRLLGELVRRYGFSPVCAGCHAYLHALRAPLARALGSPPVIAGERESHDGRVKINQVAVALDAYQGLLAGFGVDLLLPLRGVAEGAQVEGLLGRPWPEGQEQLGCAFSGNYLDAAGAPVWDEQALKAYLAEYALPLTWAALEARMEGRTVDPLELARSLDIFG